jgi:hypothetical protein
MLIQLINIYLTSTTFQLSTRSLKSRFGVQLFENMQIGLCLGTPKSYLVQMVLYCQWHSTDSGADLALFIMVPVTIIQYIISSPLYAFINNIAVTLKASATKKIDQFLKHLYIKLMVVSLLVSLTGAGILYLIGSQILHIARAAEISVWILHYALIGNVLLSIFTANSLFITPRILVSLAVTVT